MAINDETYLDRLLTSAQAAGLPHILNLDPDVNVRREDYRSLSDAYNYYLGGGRDAAQADFPIQASGITAQVPVTTDLGTGEGGTGITTAGVSTPIAPTVEETAAMEDIGAIPYIAPTVEQTAAMEDIGATDTIASLQDVTPEAQGAWQKVQSGLASVGDFIQNYGMATYNFLAGNVTAGLAGLAAGPVGLGLTAAAGALQTTPEQQAMMSAAQASGIADPNDPRKDIHGTNIVSALGDYDQSVADSIAMIEETARKKGGEDKLAPNLQKKLADYRNYQNEKAWEDVDTDMPRDEVITSPMVTELPTAEDYGDPTIMDAPDLPIDSRIADYRDPIMDMVPEQKTALDFIDLEKSIPSEIDYSKPIGERIAETTGYNVNDIALAAMEEDAELGDYATPENINKAVNVLRNVAGAVALGTPLTLKAITAQLAKQKAAGDVLGKTLGTVITKQVEGQEQDFKEEQEQREQEQEFAETGDYDVFSDTVDTGPTVDIADIGAEDEEDYSAPTAPTPRAPDFITGGGRDEPAPSKPSPTPTRSPHAPGGGGDPGGGDGGKIVCTMMNDSYGFGSFRNKIWLRQSKNLAPEYQIGYHKIFLPLVKLSKKNIVLKKILEHIAIHRTIDIRQEARGKTHMLGRVYRKILEPICYWVGKYGKRT